MYSLEAIYLRTTTVSAELFCWLLTQHQASCFTKLCHAFSSSPPVSTCRKGSAIAILLARPALSLYHTWLAYFMDYPHVMLHDLLVFLAYCAMRL